MINPQNPYTKAETDKEKKSEELEDYSQTTQSSGGN